MSQPHSRLTREDEARAEMERTAGSPVLVAGLISVFIAALFSVFVFQYADDLTQYVRGARPDAVPDVARIEPLWKVPSRVFQTLEKSGTSRLIEANRALMGEMRRYETRLEESSWLAQRVLPQAQYFFTWRFGLGNEKVYCGRKGELFYRPDVDFVTGRGFLEPAQMRRRQLSGADRNISVEPDPLTAIRDFNRELKELGIKLIVMPVPAKPTLKASNLYKHYPDDIPLPQNPSYATFINTLREEGIEVFDCLETLANHKKAGYLKQDTHWKPSGAALAAEMLARRIRTLNLLPKQPPAGYTRREVDVANKGDIAAMLRLPEGDRFYNPEWAELFQVISPDQKLWTKSDHSDVLLLGDSFANIYSMPALNWGVSAGLAEQLSYYLQRPVDRITMNDNGSFATRLELARRQRAGLHPLQGKRIVIWEFAARELSQGDWRKITINPDR